MDWKVVLEDLCQSDLCCPPYLNMYPRGRSTLVYKAFSIASCSLAIICLLKAFRLFVKNKEVYPN
jgi:hypothetical protein